jgi:transposase-like protein
VKRRYQKEHEKAAARFEEWAKSGETKPIQLAFGTAEMVELVRDGLGKLVERIGKEFIETVLEAEAEHQAGPRSHRGTERTVYRWGREQGYCVVNGQKVPIARPRLRSKMHDEEIPLGSYELFQRASLIEETVWHKILHGLSTRGYQEVVTQFAGAYGLEKSAISRHFIEASRMKLQELMTRTVAQLPLAVILVDGTIFQGEHLIVALGIDYFGRKLVLGIRQGATENAAVVSALLEDLAGRGVDFSAPRLYVTDGSRAIQAAIRRHAGNAAFFQRCQVHKIRNVTEHVPIEKRDAVTFKMRAAYQRDEVADARQDLQRLHEELLAINPDAAASLTEGMEETLTVIELRLPRLLRRSLSSTNSLESGFSTVERICRNVKRWRGSDMRLRWVGSAMLFAEKRWARLMGYRHVTLLVSALKSAHALRKYEHNVALRQQVSAA